MRRVLWALLPGIMLYSWLFGWAIWIQIILACSVAVLLEALVLRIRNAPILPAICDGSSLVAATLFALSIPPFAAWWVGLLGIFFAIVVVKHLYGGLGYNLVNPAMSAYLLVWLCFPTQFVHWPILATAQDAGFATHFSLIFTNAVDVDTLSGATVLSYNQEGLSRQLLLPEIHAPLIYGLIGGKGWEWVNFSFALGGLFLVLTRSIDWRTPLALLGSLFIISSICHWYDAGRHASAWFHLFSGGAMLSAFFIATEPVSGANTSMGRWIYGAAIGLLIYGIRAFGHAADGVALAVVAMNCAAPLIDTWCRPRRRMA